MTTQTDNFNRSDGALGSNWTRTVNNSGVAEIYSNRFRLTSGGYQAYVYTGGTALGANQAVEAKVYFPGSGGVALLARASGTDGNSYGLYLPYTGAWEIDILDASGTPTAQLASGTVSIVAGAVLKLVANGTTLTAYYNGVELASVTDSTHATGRTGVYFAAAGNTVEVDDFSATDELGGGATVAGQTLTATGSLTKGPVTGGAAVASKTLTASTSLLAGGASTAGSVSVAGQVLASTAALIAGAVTGAAAVAGQTLTASTSLVVGAATGAASVAGRMLTATGSLIAGAVTGAAAVSGRTLTATASLIAGAASGGTVTVAGQILTATATLISGMGGAVAGLWGRLWRGSLWAGGVFRG